CCHSEHKFFVKATFYNGAQPMKTLCFFLLATSPVFAQNLPASVELERALEPIRASSGVPALGAAIVREDGEVVVAVTGVRKYGADTRAAVSDEWHLGSDTKAMTATIIAHLVEHGRLRWETTIGEVFKREGQSFPTEFRNITLLQL